MRLYKWCDDLIVARDKHEAIRLLQDQFTVGEVRKYGSVEEVMHPVMLIDENENQREYTPSQVCQQFPKPQIIPESPL